MFFGEDTIKYTVKCFKHHNCSVIKSFGPRIPADLSIRSQQWLRAGLLDTVPTRQEHKQHDFCAVLSCFDSQRT